MTREEAIIELRLDPSINEDVSEEYNDAIDMAIEALSQPEQKVGHWIKYGVPRCDEQHYQCTNCEYYINFGMWGKVYTKEFKYCPNCGAKMVETQESEVVYAKSNN